MIVSKENYDELQEGLDKINLELDLGTRMSAVFEDGPRAGTDLLVRCENGIPKTMRGFFIVDNIFIFSEKTLQAEYLWDISKAAFVYTGATKMDFVKSKGRSV